MHCVQNTQGAEIIPEIDASKFQHIVAKGRDSRVEMFSAFADVFGNKTSMAASLDLAELLESAGVSHVFVAGLAGDHCVRCTALDGKKEGFKVFVIEEATKSVNAGDNGWGAAKEHLEKAGVMVIYIDDPIIEQLGSLS